MRIGKQILICCTAQIIPKYIRQFSIAVALPARAERILLNFLCSCLSCAFFCPFECSRTRHESRTTFNFLDVPARLIFHVIKIGRSTRAGKATAIENCLWGAAGMVICLILTCPSFTSQPNSLIINKGVT